MHIPSLLLAGHLQQNGSGAPPVRPGTAVDLLADLLADAVVVSPQQQQQQQQTGAHQVG